MSKKPRDAEGQQIPKGAGGKRPAHKAAPFLVSRRTEINEQLVDGHDGHDPEGDWPEGDWPESDWPAEGPAEGPTANE